MFMSHVKATLVAVHKQAGTAVGTVIKHLLNTEKSAPTETFLPADYTSWHSIENTQFIILGE